MLEDLIAKKKEECSAALLSQYPDLAIGKKVSSLSLHYAKKPLPDQAKELMVWEELSEDRYWHALPHLVELSKTNYFSEQELKTLADIMISQTMNGKAIAVGFPFYSDIWTMLGGKESPIKQYITETHKKQAVNLGFWKLLPKTSSPEVCQEIDKIMDYELFFNYFDFNEGAKKASELPENLRFTDAMDLHAYTIWYLVQEREICRQFEKEKANDICGRLIAPFTGSLFCNMDYDHSRQLRSLANAFISSDLIKTPAMQSMIGGVFESELERALLDDDYSPELLKKSESGLIDTKKHIQTVWGKVKDQIKPQEINSFKEYIPKEFYASKVAALKAQLKSMKKFDVSVFGRWLTYKNVVSSGEFGRVRNLALGVYYAQKPRPSGEVISTVSYSGAADDKLNGFLFCDFILRKKWSKANKILISYDNALYGIKRSSRRNFYQGLGEYARLHGKVKINKEGLDKRACYPSYNKLADFYNEHTSFFILTP